MLVAGRRRDRDCVVCCEESAREREGQRRKIFDGRIFRMVEVEATPCVVFIEGALLANLKSIG